MCLTKSVRRPEERRNVTLFVLERIDRIQPRRFERRLGAGRASFGNRGFLGLGKPHWLQFGQQERT